MLNLPSFLVPLAERFGIRRRKAPIRRGDKKNRKPDATDAGPTSQPYLHDLRDRYPIEVGKSDAAPPPSLDLCKRIVDSFGKARATYEVERDSTWFFIQRRSQQPFLDAIADPSGKALQGFLHDIYQGKALQGMDQHARVTQGPGLGYALAAYDALVRVCEAIGVLSLENPFPSHRDERNKNVKIAPDELLSGLDAALGFRVMPALVGHGKIGLKTSRGVFNYRDFMNLYTGYRVHQLVSDLKDPWVVEIGGGFGKAALYAWQLGVRCYTIIDLPYVNALQAFLLGTCLPGGRVNLFGETEQAGQPGVIDILPPIRFGTLQSIDLVLNQNSLPEMGRANALGYLQQSRANARRFLSINQEAAKTMTPDGVRQNVVRELVNAVGGYRLVHRLPFWMRQDHVEELYVIQADSANTAKN
jgi:hypothetical protein